MTSFRSSLIESTGPKNRSWQTAIAAKCSSARIDRRNRRCRSLEDIEDYQALKRLSSRRDDVERELVLRLASLLWRMRRASAIETDLFQIQAEILSDRQYEYETGIGPRITERVINRFDEQRLWRSMRSNLREIAYRIDPALWVHHILGVARGFFKGTARRVHSGDRASA